MFTPNLCVIQDPNTKGRIGLAEFKAGLYMFSNTEKSLALDGKTSCNSINRNLWHDRLGHLSDNRLSILKQKYPYIHSDKIDICDACNFAKHKKLPYSNNTTVVNHPFYIIHIDIWGPCSTPSMHAHKY